MLRKPPTAPVLCAGSAGTCGQYRAAPAGADSRTAPTLWPRGMFRFRTVDTAAAGTVVEERGATLYVGTRRVGVGAALITAVVWCAWPMTATAVSRHRAPLSRGHTDVRRAESARAHAATTRAARTPRAPTAVHHPRRARARALRARTAHRRRAEMAVARLGSSLALWRRRGQATGRVRQSGRAGASRPGRATSAQTSVSSACAPDGAYVCTTSVTAVPVPPSTASSAQGVVSSTGAIVTTRICQNGSHACAASRTTFTWSADPNGGATATSESCNVDRSPPCRPVGPPTAYPATCKPMETCNRVVLCTVFANNSGAQCEVSVQNYASTTCAAPGATCAAGPTITSRDTSVSGKLPDVCESYLPEICATSSTGTARSLRGPSCVQPEVCPAQVGAGDPCRPSRLGRRPDL